MFFDLRFWIATRDMAVERKVLVKCVLEPNGSSSKSLSWLQSMKRQEELLILSFVDVFYPLMFCLLIFCFQESDIEPRRSTIKLPVRVKIIPTPPRRYVEVYIAKPL